MPARIIEGTGRYLLQVSRGNFFTHLDGNNRPFCTPYPSKARHMSYEEADQICQEIRIAGYKDAVVTDLFGRAVDFPSLAEERKRQDAKSAWFWGE